MKSSIIKIPPQGLQVWIENRKAGRKGVALQSVSLIGSKGVALQSVSLIGSKDAALQSVSLVVSKGLPFNL
ncbi:MAG: hypothetical protein IJU71_08925 [Selenomonadaceae bacterium]|nr:hypothetical protein [Selenomonadaceae bacterium]